MVRPMALGVPYTTSSGAVPCHPGWAGGGSRGGSVGLVGSVRSGRPVCGFSPLEAADEQSIFLSLALTEQRGLEFTGLSIPAGDFSC